MRSEDRHEWAMLVEFEEDTIRHQWSLAQDVTRIGRWPDNEVVVDDRWTSRHHAEVRREGAQYILYDLDSKNGTLVNGQRITRPYRLTDGDQISVAPLHTLTFVDYAATAPLPEQRVRALELLFETRDLRVWGKRLDPPLSQVQFDFLAALAREPGTARSRDEMIAATWPGEDPGAISDDAVNALLHRLRQRLHELEPRHDFIETVRGYGFRLTLPHG